MQHSADVEDVGDGLVIQNYIEQQGNMIRCVGHQLLVKLVKAAGTMDATVLQYVWDMP